MLSTDGHCYAFDKRANGLVPGEAVAVVVLKCLSQAEADGDPIYAVIDGSGINYDGKTNGITAPNGVSQTTYSTPCMNVSASTQRRSSTSSLMARAHAWAIRSKSRRSKMPS